MRDLLKILSFVFCYPLVVITFFLGAANLMEGYNILAPYKGTNFSENYSPDEFDKIKLGMSIDEVKAIIGNPMYISQDTLPNKTVEIFDMRSAPSAQSQMPLRGLKRGYRFFYIRLDQVFAQ